MLADGYKSYAYKSNGLVYKLRRVEQKKAREKVCKFTWVPIAQITTTRQKMHLLGPLQSSMKSKHFGRPSHPISVIPLTKVGLLMSILTEANN